jgi:hypothetical protein
MCIQELREVNPVAGFERVKYDELEIDVLETV